MDAGDGPLSVQDFQFGFRFKGIPRLDRDPTIAVALDIGVAHVRLHRPRFYVGVGTEVRAATKSGSDLVWSGDISHAIHGFQLCLRLVSAAGLDGNGRLTNSGRVTKAL